MDIVDRLSDLISTSKLSVRAFAAKHGVKQQTLSNQINRIRELSLTTVLAILTSDENISAEWLLRGNGEMFIGENQIDTKTAEKMNKLIDTITTLQDTINSKNDAIATLSNRVMQLENQLGK